MSPSVNPGFSIAGTHDAEHKDVNETTERATKVSDNIVNLLYSIQELAFYGPIKSVKSNYSRKIPFIVVWETQSYDKVNSAHSHRLFYLLHVKQIFIKKQIVLNVLITKKSN